MHRLVSIGSKELLKQLNTAPTCPGIYIYHLVLTTTQCSRSYYPIFPMKILRLKSKFACITASEQ